jgi:hypothetical protein
MYASLNGKILTGKAAEVFTKIGIATECDAPVNKVAKVKAAKPAPKTPVKKVAKKVKK